MSKISSLLIWKKPVPIGISNEAASKMFFPGDVVDIQAGIFNFGEEIQKLGWWKVIVVTCPPEMLRKLVAGDKEDPWDAQKYSRLRTFRLNLSRLQDRMSFDEIMAIVKEVPKKATSPSIG